MSQNKKWQVRIFFIGWMVLLFLFLRDTRFGFLALNTLLGYIPIELSFHIGNKPHQNSFVFWLLSLLWLLFYPNSPYILTDLLHLAWLHPDEANGLLRLDPHVWFLYTCLMISALSCAFIGFWSLVHVAKAIDVKIHLPGNFSNFVTIVILTVASSIGLFIGRFMRVHTIYLILSPRMYIRPFLNMWNMHMLVFVFLMTVLQLMIYWIYTIISNNKE
ncbi:DUF1361 domain-containing protein [Fructilactobacillus fructivorans]|uniref:Membrane protein n=1 Tax=Fructilactobacillus fructivorans TaxID=1614 RepID=A0A0C1PP02_9LACO|nr:DUF1361 domain-containing protein [Fructilactobacillus fructivorans]KID41641.1 membrane protein [Fructilactobacillus fructivorans]KRN12685.1 hypothetical protein IV37_GL000985 [Fructilactobacillus fructivorans]KRN40651.1 hypothetical protein IV51_GL001272 [Fructilactobacillus fructivorans]KRN43192.1 hypothetical protein IV48_GL000747 [Fructilactobacillus fructivorans]MCT0151292.1 DUF1361 domain-containing protein [Fructilactobacillus fructivorans]